MHAISTNEPQVREADLMKMINENDNRLFDCLYKRYWEQLLKFTAQYFDDEDTCKEIVQDLFVHIHSIQHRLKITTSITAYLYMSIRHRIYNYIRNRNVYKRHMVCIGQKKPKAENNIDQFMNLSDLQKMVGQSLQIIPCRYRQVYLLHHQYQYNVKKIAVVLKRPPDTVEKQLRKSVRIIRDHLNKSLLASDRFSIVS